MKKLFGYVVRMKDDRRVLMRRISGETKIGRPRIKNGCRLKMKGDFLVQNQEGKQDKMVKIGRKL